MMKTSKPGFRSRVEEEDRGRRTRAREKANSTRKGKKRDLEEVEEFLITFDVAWSRQETETEPKRRDNEEVEQER